jgi:hypothetical protein
MSLEHSSSHLRQPVNKSGESAKHLKPFGHSRTESPASQHLSRRSSQPKRRLGDFVHDVYMRTYTFRHRGKLRKWSVLEESFSRTFNAVQTVERIWTGTSSTPGWHARWAGNTGWAEGFYRSRLFTSDPTQKFGLWVGQQTATGSCTAQGGESWLVLVDPEVASGTDAMMYTSDDPARVWPSFIAEWSPCIARQRGGVRYVTVRNKKIFPVAP